MKNGEFILNRLKIIRRMALCQVICCFILQSFAFAQPSLDESIDCTKVQIDYTNDSTLTREERIRRMDKAFYESLSKFELCQSEMEKSGASAGGAGGGGNGSNGSQGENGASGQSANAGKPGSTSSEAMADESTQASTASSTMSGTESENKNTGMERNQTGDSDMNSNTSQSNTANTTQGIQHTAAGGQRPADIPPSDNDNALAAQIRYAAEKETDPVKKAQLWNEYRKYKGLPLKK